MVEAHKFGRKNSNLRKAGAVSKLKSNEDPKQLNSFLGRMQSPRFRRVYPKN